MIERQRQSDIRLPAIAAADGQVLAASSKNFHDYFMRFMERDPAVVATPVDEALREMFKGVSPDLTLAMERLIAACDGKRTAGYILAELYCFSDPVAALNLALKELPIPANPHLRFVSGKQFRRRLAEMRAEESLADGTVPVILMKDALTLAVMDKPVSSKSGRDMKGAMDASFALAVHRDDTFNEK